MSTTLDAIRKAIISSGQTRYRIAKGSGVSQSQLSRLVSGAQGMSIENVERLADYLGLRITIEPKTKTRKGH